MFASTDGGAFVPWQRRTSSTSAAYPGATGHSYAFYSVATDHAGNRQATPAGAQTSTIVEAMGVTPSEGTLGTQLVVEGAGFGTKGKLLLGSTPLKVGSWSDGRITATVVKKAGPATYNVSVQPKLPKGTPPVTIPQAFTILAPQVTGVSPAHGTAGATVTVTGRFFGTKKGKVYLGSKVCAVQSWSMTPGTGESRLTFTVPKGLTPGIYDLNVTNAIGTGILPGGFTAD